MPQSRKQEAEPKVEIHPSFALAVATKRDVNILCKKPCQCNMPSFPEIHDINSLIGGYDRGSTFKENIDTSKYIIVLDHEPNDYDMEATSDADLVLSGHTHGGQMIPITYVGEWFGINDRTYGYERRNNI